MKLLLPYSDTDNFKSSYLCSTCSRFHFFGQTAGIYLQCLNYAEIGPIHWLSFHWLVYGINVDVVSHWLNIDRVQ